MKNTATEPLRASIRTNAELDAEIVTLNQLVTDTAARRQSLECSCDLADEKSLDEITRLQVVEALLPRRIAARVASKDEAEKNIVAAAHAFIRAGLGPRTRALLEQAKAKAKAAFAPLYTDPDLLDKAVQNSSLVMELWAMSPTISQPANVVRYAEDLLALWAKADAIEAKLA